MVSIGMILLNVELERYIAAKHPKNKEIQLSMICISVKLYFKRQDRHHCSLWRIFSLRTHVTIHSGSVNQGNLYILKYHHRWLEFKENRMRII